MLDDFRMVRGDASSINFQAIQTLCKIALDSQKIVIQITNSGYGIGQEDVFCTETSLLNSIMLYGKTKVDTEGVVLERGNAISLRLATGLCRNTLSMMGYLN